MRGASTLACSAIDPGWRAPPRGARPRRDRSAGGRAHLRASCVARGARSAPRPATASRSRSPRARLRGRRCTRACSRGAVAMPVDPRLASPSERRSSREAGIVIDAPLDAGRRRLRTCPIRATRRSSSTPRARRARRVRSSSRRQHRSPTRSAARRAGPFAHERWLCPLPLSHVGGLMVLLRSAIRARPRCSARGATTSRSPRWST